MNSPAFGARFAIPSRKGPQLRLQAATGIHKGDRQYQQDQVAVMVHPHHARCLLAVVADGMGGKSGGRKAADQVLLTAQQLFERFAPDSEDPVELLRQICSEAHLMIKLTAISAEEEPHSTLALFIVLPDLRCYWLHTGDSRIYWVNDGQFKQRTFDQSYVQRLVDEGQLSEADAQSHPQSNLLTACLGTQQEPTPVVTEIGPLRAGDALMVCSDGLWHYFSNRELATVLSGLTPREAAELLINKARQRSQGGGDNLSLAIVRLVEGD
ncbi:PP2C family serine/threonine-protein phosphatase [Inhella sp.]|uniref:PP2C family protein-serine/threonine phosphatase n=1 Tax=Inhella sp. TaxID=1921806 RepID=UPI0035B4C435